MEPDIPTLLSCYCGEKHIEPRCPNLDMAKLLELGRIEVAKERLMREGIQFDEWAGEDDSGWWFFVRVVAGENEVCARRSRAEALNAAIRFASMAQVRGEAK
jgi:hypothetical protein